MLIKLSVFIAGFKKDAPQITSENVVALEPYLDPQPSATNSGTINITGSAVEGTVVLIFVNESKKDEKIIGKDGLFTFSNVRLIEGANEIYAIAKYDKKESPPSTKMTLTYKTEPPILEITTPKDADKITGENEVEIVGVTEVDSSVTINERYVLVSPNGEFSGQFKLTSGENKFEIKSVDLAGNSSTKTIQVVYEP